MSVDFLVANSSRIAFGSGGLLNNQEPFSISFWYVPRGPGAGNLARPFSKGASTGSGDFSLRHDGTVNQFIFSKDYVTTDFSVSMSSGLLSNSMNHLLFTWSGSSSGGVNLYTNGVQQATFAITNGAGAKQSDAPGNLAFGNLGSTLTRSVNGIISEIAFWGSALLDINDAQRLFNSRMRGMPLQIQASSLRLYAPLDDYPQGLASATSGAYKDRSKNNLNGSPQFGAGGANPPSEDRSVQSYA